jgi:predicted HicB family RNase H-like nuclease
MTNRQIDKKVTKQVRIDMGLHQLLKIQAAKDGMSIRTLLEGYVADILNEKKENKNE